MLSESIYRLVRYGMDTGLTPECEKNYTIKRLLELFKEDDYIEPEESGTQPDLEAILKAPLDEAVARGIISDGIVVRALFDTELMNWLITRQ